MVQTSGLTNCYERRLWAKMYIIGIFIFWYCFPLLSEQKCMKRPICQEFLFGHYKMNELNHVQLFAHSLWSGPNKWLAATTYFLAVKTVLISIHFKFSGVIYCSNHFAKTMSRCRILKMYSADWSRAFVCTSKLMLPPW